MSIMSQRHTHLWVKTIKHVVLTDGHIEVNPCLDLLGFYSHQVPVRRICLFFAKNWLVGHFKLCESKYFSIFCEQMCEVKSLKSLSWTHLASRKFPASQSSCPQNSPFYFGSHTILKQFQVPLTVLCLCLHFSSVTQQCVTGIRM